MKHRGTRALSAIPRRWCQRRDPGPADCKYYYVASDRRSLVRMSAFPEGYSRACMPKKAPTMFMKLPAVAPCCGRESTDSTPAIRPISYERRGYTSELVRELEGRRGPNCGHFDRRFRRVCVFYR